MTAGLLAGLFERTARSDRGFRYGAEEAGLFVSYADLLSEARSLAAALGRLDQRPRFIAAIWMEPSPSCYAAFMAVVLANGIPVPLHGSASADQVSDALEKLEAEVLLTVRSRWLPVTGSDGLARASAAGTIVVDGQTGEPYEAARDTSRGRRARSYEPPAETAVVFMSSGSTGKPKGILLSERNLLSNLASIQASLRLTEADTVLMTKSFGYSSTITGEWLLALQAGMHIALAPGLLHPLQLVREIKRSRPTFLCTVPAVLLPLAKSSRWDARDLASLAKLIVVGAAMPSETLLRLSERLPEVEIMPCYGLTEASPRVTCLPARQLAARPSSAGAAIPGVAISIRRDGMTVAPGEEGELYVNGPNVMLGYYDDDQRTSYALTVHGLRTMDRGYMDEDGYLFLSGRSDSAFNVAGHLFHPETLERTLLSHPAVREAAVTGVPDPIAGQRPVAYVIPERLSLDEAQALAAELHAYCLNRMSAEGRPKDIAVVGELPRTPSGKADRKAIQQMAKERDYDSRDGAIAAGTDGR
ncbi:class I adenylate-forming enzyme family protein [Cohnella sp. GCM10027633]|uniref:class I adenylate-forming enzyme family protein n=1 Tax=unclassified Cohnella TaxID=2636738 RepID=UPI0036374918